MKPALRNLLLRSNRYLGAALVEADLVTLPNLEAATERLLQLVAAGNARQSNVLGVLAYEMKVLREEDVLQHLADEHGAGLVDLRDVELAEDLKQHLDPEACWATWTLPFDREEGFNSVASACFLSSAARTYWEKHLDGPIIWYGATIESIADQLEKLTAARAAAMPVPAAAPPAA
jgi:hypothetical protein